MCSASIRPRRLLASAVLLLAVFGASAASAAGRAGDKTKPEDPALPAAGVRLSLSIPSARGPWNLILENRESVPVRVVADARNLTLLVRAADGAKYEVCKLPASMRASPESRQLVLEPGDRYEERIEPALFCWGKLHDLLLPGSSVTAFLGWAPDARLERQHKPQKPPFLLEPAVAPATVRNDKQLASLTMWLPAPDPMGAHASPGPGGPGPHGPGADEHPHGHAAAPPDAQPKPPPPRPLGVAHFELSASRFEDAASFRSASVSATVQNSGDRAGVIHLRADGLELRVARPDGSRAVCAPPEGKRAPARDFFQTIAPGKSSSVQALVNEVCPRGTFDRPGLYVIDVTLHAKDHGREFGLDAVAGRFIAPNPVLLRVQQSLQPYHPDPPRAQKTRQK